MNNKIKEYFKHKKFSNLEFLSNKGIWANDKRYIGFYFFLLEFQGKETSHIFDKIINANGSKSKAHLYLADIAYELFNHIETLHIPKYHYQQVVVHDKNETQAWWMLYFLGRDCCALLEAISRDYESKKIAQINENIRSLYPSPLLTADYSQCEWNQLKTLISAPELLYGTDIQIICCYFLGQFEEGIDLIKQQDHVRFDVIRKYLDGHYCDMELALSKVDYSFKIKLLEGNPERIYEEIKKEAEKGNTNPTKEVVIRYAFEAEKYADVIALVDDVILTNKSSHNLVDKKLYHLLSSINLGLKLNDDFVRDIEKQSFFKNSKYDLLLKALYLAFKVRRNIQKLESNLDRDASNLHSIHNEKLYLDAELYLNDSSFIKHYLYDPLHTELSVLKKKWSKKCTFSEIKQLTEKYVSLKNEEIERLASLLIKVGKIEKAITHLEALSPSMTRSNLLGVSYSNLGKHSEALEQYQYSLELMTSSGEENDVIISNYLTGIEKAGVTLSENRYNELKEKYNNSLANHFKYGIFTAKNGHSLFKYYPFNKNTLDALVNKYFYLASSEQLNDPIELPYDSLNSIKSDNLIEPHFKLSSFSNNENSMLMWSHYTENHEGLMIEYCFEGDLPDGIGIEKVSYSNSNKRFKEKELYVFNQYMLTKNEEWSYEQEVRLFAYKKSKVYYEHYEYPKKQGDNAGAYINSITLGYKFPESMIKLIVSIISDLNANYGQGIPKIKLRKAKLSLSNCFELEYEDINLRYSIDSS